MPLLSQKEKRQILCIVAGVAVLVLGLAIYDRNKPAPNPDFVPTVEPGRQGNNWINTGADGEGRHGFAGNVTVIDGRTLDLAGVRLSLAARSGDTATRTGA